MMVNNERSKIENSSSGTVTNTLPVKIFIWFEFQYYDKNLHNQN